MQTLLTLLYVIGNNLAFYIEIIYLHHISMFIPAECATYLGEYNQNQYGKGLSLLSDLSTISNQDCPWEHVL